jgi:hypothetical protein
MNAKILALQNLFVDLGPVKIKKIENRGRKIEERR